MNRIAEPDDHLTGEDEPSVDALGEMLLLADTLEDDADRYQDVLRELEEFEGASVESEAEAASTVEGVRDLDTRPEITVT